LKASYSVKHCISKRSVADRCPHPVQACLEKHVPSVQSTELLTYNILRLDIF
jgi:hypothetical protein